MTRSAQDAFSLASWHLPNWKPGLIFDVGANSGQTAGKMVQRAPEARIHAFAPFPDTYRELVANMQAHPNVVPHNLALGRAAASLNMEKHRDSRRSRLLPGAGGGTGSELVEVQVRTGAEVLRELGAPRIDILKIDTEGHDYDVLIGFLPVIDQVDFIQMDAAMNPYDRTHVPLWRFEDLPVASGVPPVSHLRSEDGGEARRSSSPATLQSGFQQWSVGVPAQDSGG